MDLLLLAILLLGRLKYKILLTELNSRTPTLTPNPNDPRTLTPHLSLTNIALQTVNSAFHQCSLITHSKTDPQRILLVVFRIQRGTKKRTNCSSSYVLYVLQGLVNSFKTLSVIYQNFSEHNLSFEKTSRSNSYVYCIVLLLL